MSSFPPAQLTRWLDCAAQANIQYKLNAIDTKLWVSLILQSCFSDVVALKIKTKGNYSRGIMSLCTFAVRAGDEVFRVVEQTPWLEKDNVEHIQTKQLEKLMGHAVIQPEVDMKTMLIKQWSKPVSVDQETPISPWARSVRGPDQSVGPISHGAPAGVHAG